MSFTSNSLVDGKMTSIKEHNGISFLYQFPPQICIVEKQICNKFNCDALMVITINTTLI